MNATGECEYKARHTSSYSLLPVSYSGIKEKKTSWFNVKRDESKKSLREEIWPFPRVLYGTNDKFL